MGNTFNTSLSGLRKLLTGLNIASTPSGLTIGGKVTVVTVNDTTWTALPLVPLAQRNQINIQNDDASIAIKLNYDPTTVGYVGMVVGPGIEKGYAIKDTILIYAKSASGSVVLNIEEIA